MRPLAATAACLALASLLAACDDSPEKKPGDTATYAYGEGDQYVAIGDSYTSAPGSGPAAKGSPAGCSQTSVNYPHRIAEATGMELLDHSCNGANTTAVLGPQETVTSHQVIQEPQVDGIDDDTDLITFRLGANDYSLINRTFQCSIAYAGRKLGSSEAPCTALDASSKGGPAAEALAELTTNVQTVLADLRDRAPNARIIVIGYPQILPATGSCDLFPLAPGDEAWAHEILDGLNDALKAGAESIDAPYIDMAAASEGHDTCSDEPWMAGIKAVPGAAAIFHPFTAEGQAVAQLVLAELKS